MHTAKVYRVEHESTFAGPYYQEETHPDNKDIQGTNYLWWWDHDHTLSFNTEPVQLYPGCIEGLSKRTIGKLCFGFRFKVCIYHWFTENELLTLLGSNYIVATYIVPIKKIYTFEGTDQICFSKTKQIVKTRISLTFDEIFDDTYFKWKERSGVVL